MCSTFVGAEAESLALFLMTFVAGKCGVRIKRSEWLFYSLWDEEESVVFCGNDLEETRPGILVFNFSSSTMHLFPPPFSLSVEVVNNTTGFPSVLGLKGNC